MKSLTSFINENVNEGLKGGVILLKRELQEKLKALKNSQLSEANDIIKKFEEFSEYLDKVEPRFNEMYWKKQGKSKPKDDDEVWYVIGKNEYGETEVKSMDDESAAKEFVKKHSSYEVKKTTHKEYLKLSQKYFLPD